MCGRAYETYTDEELEIAYLGKSLRKKIFPERRPNYNLCPTQLSPVVLVKDGERRFELFRFGLIPNWAKSVKDASKYSLINAKGEEITEKRSYKGPFEKRRCVVPLSGFYEWRREDKIKTPFAIQRRDQSIMSVAAVYENWIDQETGEHIDSFSLITCEPNDFMAKIHNRMPVILEKNLIEEWLDPKNQNMTKLQKLLKPCSDDILEAFEVSKLVNSPKNNSANLLAKV